MRGDAALQGRCVAVHGYLSGHALFATRTDARARRAPSTRALEGRRIGLYGLAKALPKGAPREGSYEIVGIVGDCERLSAGGVAVMGYCHYTDGPYVAVSELKRIR